MSSAEQGFYPEQFTIAANATVDARAEFITKTYMHLLGAVLAFVAIEAVFLSTPIGVTLFNLVFAGGNIGWLLFIGAFILVGNLASSWAHSTSVQTQYIGLGVYVLFEALLFAPILTLASTVAPEAIPAAGIVTVATFAGLSMVVFITRKNFSFLGPALSIASFAALGLIVCSLFLPITLGVLFTGAMIVLACGYILYHTSSVLHEYPVGFHVGAALQLFASIALLFYYVLIFFLSSRD